MVNYYPDKELLLPKLEIVGTITINADLESINLPKLKEFYGLEEVLSIKSQKIPKDTAGNIKAVAGDRAISLLNMNHAFHA